MHCSAAGSRWPDPLHPAIQTQLLAACFCGNNQLLIDSFSVGTTDKQGLE